MSTSSNEVFLRLLRSFSKKANALDARLSGNGQPPDETHLDEYVTSFPSAQNAVDAVAGWNMALPPEAGAIAGTGAFFFDARITWALEQFGPLAGKTVLELGPLEASHTYMLHNGGAEEIHAIEANRLAFLRCLVVKELLNLNRAKFYLGNFVEWLKQREQKYDLIIASGVLYHMQDPISLIDLLASRTDNLFLWTHYMDEAAMPSDDPRRQVFVGSPESVEYRRITAKVHKRSYHQAWKTATFCGGMYDLHRWIDRDDLLAVLAAAGFDDVRITHDQPDHPNGPSFSVFARRTVPQGG